jgi:glycosyltransferase involved in cell wall biosynthesis
MNGGPVVSVVIIFLNEERFLGEAVESVLGQSYPSWELVLVDDGSRDASRGIAIRYAARHSDRIRCVEHDGHANRGMSASRNLGVRHARGRYVAFLDADDVWVPSTLEEQVAILDGEPAAAAVYGRVERWYSWAGVDAGNDSVRDLVVPPDRLVQPPSLCGLILQDRGVPSGILVRRDVVDKLGGYEEAFRGMYEDNAFLLKLCLHHPVFASGRCWYRYRKRMDSSCAVSVQAGRYGASRLAFLTWAERYLSSRGIRDRHLRQALQAEKRREWRRQLSARVSRWLGPGAQPFRRMYGWMSRQP